MSGHVQRHVDAILNAVSDGSWVRTYWSKREHNGCCEDDRREEGLQAPIIACGDPGGRRQDASDCLPFGHQGASRNSHPASRIAPTSAADGWALIGRLRSVNF